MPQLRPTFSESWYRVMNLRARLRGSTQVSRQFYRGERWYVVRDPAGNQYHRLSSAAYRFVGLLDGSRSVGEAWDLVGGQLADDAPTQPEVIQILSQLHAANLLEANITPDAGVLLRRHKQMQKRQLQGRLMNVLFPRIPLWDPDRFLKTWMPVMRVFISKFGALLWLVMVISAVAALIPHWDELKVAAAHAIDFKSNAINYVWLFFTFCGIKLIHELGHGFTCRRFGGEVHELGIMFLVFVPAPYVDASSAWALPNKWQRVLVGAGGMIFELFVASIIAFIWLNTHNGNYPIVAQICYNAMLIASVSTVIFNANPLLRYDGYYILSDLLEIPNLQQKAKDYALGLIKRHIFGVKNPIPLPPIGQRVWLFIYSIASGIYRVFVGVMIILVVTNQVPVLGVLMALGGVITWLVVPIWKIAYYLMLEPELHRKRFRAVAFVGAVAAAIVVLVGIIRFPAHFEATGMAEQDVDHRAILNAAQGGFVTDVLVKPGQVVGKGTPLLKLRDDQLVANLETKIHDRAAMLARLNSDMSNNPHMVGSDQEQLNYLASEIQLMQREQNQLTVAAPLEGEVIAGDLDELQGKYFHDGEPLGITVAKDNTIYIYAMLDQKDAALPFAEPPTNVEIRFSGDRGDVIKNDKDHPDRVKVIRWQPGATNIAPSSAMTTAAGEEAIPDPNDKTGRKLAIAEFPVIVEVQNDGHYQPGQRAYLRFDMQKRPLMWQWMRRLRQLLQSQSANNRWL